MNKHLYTRKHATVLPYVVFPQGLSPSNKAQKKPCYWLKQIIQ